MKEWVRRLVLFSILISGTQVIDLPFGNLSLFQISLLLTIAFGAVGMVFRGKIYTGKYLVFSILYIISSTIAWLISTNPSWADSYFLLGIMTASMIFTISNYFESVDIDLLEKTIVRSQYIVFPFSIYSIIMFYLRGGMPGKIYLFAGLSITLDDLSLLRGHASSQIRLMLPYATPPVLSVAMAMCIVILVTNKKLYKPSQRMLLIFFYGVILLLTGSRTGIIGLILGFIINSLRNFRFQIKLKTEHIISAVLGLFAIGAFVCFGNKSVYLSKMFYRFTHISFLQDRHFLVPLDGLIIWISSIKNFLFGIGFGSSINLVGSHTYLPPYFLNSFVTLVAERGILGFAIVALLISLTARILNKSRNRNNVQYKSLGLALMTELLCCIFYEALNCYMLVFIIAAAFMADRSAVTRGVL